MARTDPRDLDRIAANREGRRHTPEAQPAHAEAADQIADLPGRFLQEAGAELSGDAKAVHRELSAALRDADRATTTITAGYEGVGKALPSDRADLRKRADDTAVVHGQEAEAAWDRAAKAAERLAQAARDAAIPEPPSRREYAQVADELKMLIDGAERQDILGLADNPRYAGLLAGTWGKAALRREVGLHDAVVAHVTKGAGSKQAKAAKKAADAAMAVASQRLRAAGVPEHMMPTRFRAQDR